MLFLIGALVGTYFNMPVVLASDELLTTISCKIQNLPAQYPIDNVRILPLLVIKKTTYTATIDVLIDNISNFIANTSTIIYTVDIPNSSYTEKITSKYTKQIDYIYTLKIPSALTSKEQQLLLNFIKTHHFSFPLVFTSWGTKTTTGGYQYIPASIYFNGKFYALNSLIPGYNFNNMSISEIMNVLMSYTSTNENWLNILSIEEQAYYIRDINHQLVSSVVTFDMINQESSIIANTSITSMLNNEQDTVFYKINTVSTSTSTPLFYFTLSVNGYTTNNLFLQTSTTIPLKWIPTTSGTISQGENVMYLLQYTSSIHLPSIISNWTDYKSVIIILAGYMVIDGTQIPLITSVTLSSLRPHDLLSFNTPNVYWDNESTFSPIILNGELFNVSNSDNQINKRIFTIFTNNGISADRIKIIPVSNTSPSPIVTTIRTRHHEEMQIYQYYFPIEHNIIVIPNNSKSQQILQDYFSVKYTITLYDETTNTNILSTATLYPLYILYTPQELPNYNASEDDILVALPFSSLNNATVTIGWNFITYDKKHVQNTIVQQLSSLVYSATSHVFLGRFEIDMNSYNYHDYRVSDVRIYEDNNEIIRNSYNDLLLTGMFLTEQILPLFEHIREEEIQNNYNYPTSSLLTALSYYERPIIYGIRFPINFTDLLTSLPQNHQYLFVIDVDYPLFNYHKHYSVPFPVLSWSSLPEHMYLTISGTYSIESDIIEKVEQAATSTLYPYSLSNTSNKIVVPYIASYDILLTANRYVPISETNLPFTIKIPHSSYTAQCGTKNISYYPTQYDHIINILQIPFLITSSIRLSAVHIEHIYTDRDISLTNLLQDIHKVGTNAIYVWPNYCTTDVIQQTLSVPITELIDLTLLLSTSNNTQHYTTLSPVLRSIPLTIKYNNPTTAILPITHFPYLKGSYSKLLTEWKMTTSTNSTILVNNSAGYEIWYTYFLLPSQIPINNSSTLLYVMHDNIIFEQTLTRYTNTDFEGSLVYRHKTYVFTSAPIYNITAYAYAKLNYWYPENDPSRKHYIWFAWVDSERMYHVLFTDTNNVSNNKINYDSTSLTPYINLVFPSKSYSYEQWLFKNDTQDKYMLFLFESGLHGSNFVRTLQNFHFFSGAKNGSAYVIARGFDPYHVRFDNNNWVIDMIRLSFVSPYSTLPIRRIIINDKNNQKHFIYYNSPLKGTPPNSYMKTCVQHYTSFEDIVHNCISSISLTSP